ncbi:MULTISPECIES: flagellar hook-length control protein FliK [unclassified Pseudoalteromonas]|uniref:flagellar hook-length control protein FliK n=1 Tax=unclassified Pseudoalteromonas TaxID=194690 RepID=UPI002097B03D|nr:flagellar hook-length control protein FliK [Pseudoalteromonas sp. XMcav2-N]MCO7190010.1 flagellar hook-length control protein FliK [Pseudoalteromonas sp. XMcav2-N]
MVNVSLEVAINNGVSAKGKDQTEQSEDSGFLAMLAQAEQDSSDEASQSNTDEAGEYMPLPGGLDRRLGLDDSQLPAGKKTLPDEPLKLDDSALPGKTDPKMGAGTVVTPGTDTATDTSSSHADDLLLQIKSSNAQSTDLAQNLAPVPKALKDYLSKAEQVTGPDNTKPVNGIGPVLPSPAEQNSDDTELPDVSANAEAQSGVVKKPTLDASLYGSGKLGQGEVRIEEPGDPIVAKRVDKVGPVISQPTDETGLQTQNKPAEGDVKLDPIAQLAKGESADSAKQAADTATGKQGNTEAAVKLANEAQSVKADTELQPLRDNASAHSRAAHSDVSELQPSSAGKSRRPVDQIGPVVTAPQGDKERVQGDEQVIKSQQPAKSSATVATTTTTTELKAMVDSLTPEQKQLLETNLRAQLKSGELSDPEQRAKAQQVLHELGAKPAQSAASKPQSAIEPGSKQADVTDKPPKSAIAEKDVKVFSATDHAAPDKVNKQAAALSQSGAGSVDAKSPGKENVQQTVVADTLEGEHPELAQLKKEGGQPEQQNSQQRSAMPAPVENIFKAIRGERPDEGMKHEFNEVLAQVEQVRQSQQVNQQSAVNQKAMQTDPAISQAINIARNDAVKALQERVNMMLNINNKEAEIRLDPPELGSMQIRIRSEGEQAQVNFVVQNQQAKEQLEQSMPKLREMLAEQGIQLGESNIQQGQGGEQQQQEASQGHGTLANNVSEAQNNGQQSTTSRRQSDSAIDYYA